MTLTESIAPPRKIRNQEDRPCVKLGVKHRLSRLAYCLSGLLWLTATPLYALRPDSLALLTMAPAWLWLLPGLSLAGIRLRRKLVTLLWLLWVGFALGYVDELKPLFHLHAALNYPDLQKQANVFRVVSLNCAGGDPKIAQEVILWQPDLVLLQEAPTESHVRALAKRLYGTPDACAIGLDTAILSRRLIPVTPPRSLRRHAFARISVASQPVFLASIRLTPSSLAMGMTLQTASRRNRRAELNEILRFVPSNERVLLGGDMNVPAGDGALSPLREKGFQDTFALAGTGWGNTVDNHLPIHRIDQIHILKLLPPISTTAVPSPGSDHRMIVVDFR